jgi:hypothetical protein
MTDVEITVLNGTALDEGSENVVLNITVTNTNQIVCAASTDAYYYVSITDGTNTLEYTFVVTAPGTIAPAHEENWVVENSTALGTITGSSGVIYYPAA